MIVRGGRVVLEAYHRMSEDDKPGIASAAKSIYSNVLGILVAEGGLKSADELVVDYYPEMMEVKEGEGNKPGRYAFPANRGITFRHLICNVSGYMKPGEAPGKVFNYQSWGMNVLTHALAKIYGLYDVGRSRGTARFQGADPGEAGRQDRRKLGVQVQQPSSITTGCKRAPGSTSLATIRQVHSTALDLARVGWLWCNWGRWEGEQIVPEAWLRETSVVAPDILANCPRGSSGCTGTASGPTPKAYCGPICRARRSARAARAATTGPCSRARNWSWCKIRVDTTPAREAKCPIRRCSRWCSTPAFPSQRSETMEFPTIRPNGANYVRPRKDEALDLTPPGFCWWRAAERGECQYRLVVTRAGAEVYASPLTSDPIHVPSVVFQPGEYAWHVEAVANDGSVGAISQTRAFLINENAPAQPWVDPRILLDGVPAEHPRIFFPASQLDAVRATLHSTRAEAFGELRRMADAGLSAEPIPEPDYDRIADPAERRLAYFQSFHDTRVVHDQAMRALALTYLLTGERRYGEHARVLLLDAAGWDPEGISSILAPYGDEVGLGLLKVGAEVYDWLYDLLLPDERVQVAAMLAARADQMIRRLEQNDYTYQPEGSHDGRLPGFLLEHALALAEHPRAAAWADYALKVIATNFPHWAGQDGGWAQGVPYAMFYNLRDTMPFHAWKLATGHDVWLKPFYQKLPWFFYYAVSPVGEIMPFGDSEQDPVRPSLARTLMLYHGLRLQDARLCRWADQVGGAERAPIDPFPAILVEDRVERAAAEAPAHDRAFRGIGWAALHSDATRPREDLMVLLRSSPYGGVSHGHASQNDLAVMKGGKALICAGGERFPHHGSPFHTGYAQQSISHNCVLVDGQGAINRDGSRGGEIVAFETDGAFGYACGEAENAYGELLTKWRRHLILVRPSTLILVDDLSRSQAGDLSVAAARAGAL